MRLFSNGRYDSFNMLGQLITSHFLFSFYGEFFMKNDKANIHTAVSFWATTFLLITATLLLLPPSPCAASPFIPATGQTASYQSGDDGNLRQGISWPSPRFEDNVDGTVRDTLTGLLWLKNAGCFGQQNWSTALNNSADLADGRCGLADGSTSGDWRLPNIRELDSLVHSGVYGPAVPNRAGSGQASITDPFFLLQSARYWSSTSNPQFTPQAFTVNFLGGDRVTAAKSASMYALYVRNDATASPNAQSFSTGQTNCYNSGGATISCSGTGQDGDLQNGRTWPTPRFTDMGDGTVYDNLTELTWLKNSNCRGPMIWATAVTQARALAEGDCGLSDDSRPGDWRLPNRNELSSLIDYGNQSPALSDTGGNGIWNQGDPFLNVQPSSWYWTSTTAADAAITAWLVSLREGAIGTESKQNIAHFWPVRGDKLEILTVEIIGNTAATATSSPGGISCPGICSAEFARDSLVTLTVHVPDDAVFSGWSLSSCGTNSECVVTMSTSTTVLAHFAQDTPTVAPWLLLLLGD